MTNEENQEEPDYLSRKITDDAGVEMTVREWLAIRKEAGLKIDPETAEVWWTYGQTLDPYGVDPDLPEEYHQVGREYFARASENEVWVAFRDLPEQTRDALWEKHKSQLAFPAGLEGLLTERPSLVATTPIENGAEAGNHSDDAPTRPVPPKHHHGNSRRVRNKGRGVKVSRRQLYAEVWSTPLQRLGPRYGITGNGLAKICRRLNVPYPPRGYWAKRQAGKPVTQRPLPRAASNKRAHAVVTPTPPMKTKPAARVPVAHAMAVQHGPYHSTHLHRSEFRLSEVIAAFSIAGSILADRRRTADEQAAANGPAKSPRTARTEGLGPDDIGGDDFLSLSNDSDTQAIAALGWKVFCEVMAYRLASARAHSNRTRTQG